MSLAEAPSIRFLTLKVSGRWRNNADEVLQKLFFWERILQNFDSFVFEFGCRKWKRRVRSEASQGRSTGARRGSGIFQQENIRDLGRNFPFAPLFVLGEFGADKKLINAFIYVSIILRTKLSNSIMVSIYGK